MREVFPSEYLKKSVDVIYFDFHRLLIKVYIQGLHWSGNMIGVSKEELWCVSEKMVGKEVEVIGKD